MSQPSSKSNGSSKRMILGMGLLFGVLVAVVSLFVRGLGQSPTTEAAPQDPAAIQGALFEAQKWLDQAKPERAEHVLAVALEKSPDDQGLLIMLGETLGMEGKNSESYRAYEQAIVIGPDSAGLRVTAGTVANASGLTQQALEHFWMAQQLDKSSAKYPLYLAQVQRKVGEIDEAKASLVRSLKLDPNLHKAWATLADIAFQENSLSLAQQHIEKARALDPEEVVYRLLEARITRRENQPERALQMLLTMGENVVLSDASLIAEAALCYGLLQRPQDAAELYAKAVELYPEDAALQYEAALWYDRAGIEDAALVYAERAARTGHEEARMLADRLASGDSP
jgi:tetratricopeptide (TPR) repeat protein